MDNFPIELAEEIVWNIAPEADHEQHACLVDKFVDFGDPRNDDPDYVAEVCDVPREWLGE